MSFNTKYKIGSKYNHSFYSNVIKKHGISHEAVHWQSKYTQYKRFEILTSFIIDDIKQSSIVDAGCGFAEFYVYLKKNSLEPKEYIGLDMEEDMIRLAKKRLNHLDLKVSNILKETLLIKDYYICSGALNILTKEETLIFISKCFNNSNKGFIFNFLKKDTLNNVDYNDIIEFCRELPCEIKVQNGYLENDISVYLKKSLD